MSLIDTANAFTAGTTDVLPVYIARDLVTGVTDYLAAQVPDEGILKIFGHDCVDQPDGLAFTRITDWFAGEALVTHLTATFSDHGLQQIERQRRDQNPDPDERPISLGVAHSHPFGSNPEFSGVDRDTFCSFPWGVDNVHLLVDPTAGWFKVYITHKPTTGGRIRLAQVPWACYELVGTGP